MAQHHCRFHIPLRSRNIPQSPRARPQLLHLSGRRSSRYYKSLPRENFINFTGFELLLLRPRRLFALRSITRARISLYSPASAHLCFSTFTSLFLSPSRPSVSFVEGELFLVFLYFGSCYPGLLSPEFPTQLALMGFFFFGFRLKVWLQDQLHSCSVLPNTCTPLNPYTSPLLNFSCSAARFFFCFFLNF